MPAPEEGRFASVTWHAGGAVYDRLSGATHLLDEIAILLLRRGLGDAEQAFRFACAHYDGEAPDTVRKHVERAVSALRDARLL